MDTTRLGGCSINPGAAAMLDNIPSGGEMQSTGTRDAAEDLSGAAGGVAPLNRAGWHQPLVSIIITHFNYSAHITEALLSLLDQTHQRWECVVVDDCSAIEHRRRIEWIIAAIGSDKIRMLALPENVGQVPAFFAGLDATAGEFVCLLDPDDRYAPTFLTEALRAHLNETIFCPLFCCDQQLFKDGSVMSGVLTEHKMRSLKWRGGVAVVPPRPRDRLLYIPSVAKGWHWTSTSAMMFRRAALKLTRPQKPLAYKRAADAYLAQGTHLLGGTLFLTKPLVYRGVHDANGWLAGEIFATRQDKSRPARHNFTEQCLTDVMEAIRLNGGSAQLERTEAGAARHNMIARLRRSARKRWRRLLAARAG
jgi:glycosyl transferase family 2